MFHPERISEWPVIREALAWSSFANSVRAIVGVSKNVLFPVVAKYSEICEDYGFKYSEDGYLIENQIEPNEMEASTLRKLCAMGCRFHRYRGGD